MLPTTNNGDIIEAPKPIVDHNSGGMLTNALRSILIFIFSNIGIGFKSLMLKSPRLIPILLINPVGHLKTHQMH